MFDTPLNVGLLVDYWGPCGFAFFEKAKDVVGVMAVHEASHEVVLTGDVKSVGSIGTGDELVKVFAKLRGDEFVSIDNENPFMGGVVNSELTCWFNDVVFPPRKGDDSASEVFGDLHSGIG